MIRVFFTLCWWSIFLLSILASTGCNASREMAEMAYEPAVAESEMGSATKVPAPRKLVYNGSISLVVRNEPDSVLNTVRILAESSGGYMSSRGNQSITIRVPVDHFQQTMDQIAGLGEVEHRSVDAQDVTDQYTDLEIRLENARKARQTYLKLLEKAENVSEALEVERELERVNRELDQLEGQMRLLSNRIDLATISVYVREKVRPGPIGYIGVGLWKAISWLFVRG